jgi:crotonobetainyl-CoA:carnitine CoA-transferase CaiB-like acyl-CoA transferase
MMLSDLRVIEYGEFVSAPYCSRLFSDLGARVIKVEPPHVGDMARSYGPFPGDIPHLEKSGLFIFLNTGKQSVILNLGHSEGRQIFKKLIDRTDIFITNAFPRSIEELELDYLNLSKAHPKLIYCAITPFGWEGPYREYRGFNIHACALGGASWAIGNPDREPLQVPLNQCDFQGGINAAAAILVALQARKKIGRGQFIDISVSDIIATYTGSNSMSYLFYGLKWRRDGRRAWGSGGPYPYGLFACKDGYVCIIARTRRDWNRLLEALGHPDWADNPRYQDQIAMAREYPEEVDALLESLLKSYTKNELFQMARKWGFPLSPVKEVHESLEDPQLKQRKFFEFIEIPEIGKLCLPRLPFRLSNMSLKPLRPAPHLGEHNEMILVQELGISKKDMKELKEKGII